MKKEKYLTEKNIDKVSSSILDFINSQLRNNKLKFSKESSALIILDMQRYFTTKDSKAFLPSSPSIIPKVNKLIDYFHINKLNVIFTKHIDKNDKNNIMIKWWKGKIERNNPLSELDDNLKLDNSIKLEKNTYDAFNGTNLSEILEANNIKQLVVTGIVTHLCVETTIRSAFVKNYEVILPIDCTVDFNFEIAKSSMLNLSHGFCQTVLIKDIINEH